MSEKKQAIQIDDIYMGHYTDLEHGTGCTAIVAPKGAICAVDVRGGAPATRECDLLSPERTVQKAHCVMLSGGSAYGLSAATGAMEVLEDASIGFDVGAGKVPIIPSACLFDLYCGSFDVRPDANCGHIAVQNAMGDDKGADQQGNIGAGCGCTVAKFAGFDHAMKGGLGIGTKTAGDLVVQAVVAVNACGDIYNPETGELMCAPCFEQDGKDFLTPSAQILKKAQNDIPLNITNTTIGCIVTNAKLTQAEAKRVAIMAHDGYARCINPTHSPLDGDALFVMATESCEAALELVGVLAQEAVEEAIINAVVHAEALHGYKAYSDLKK